MGRKVKNGQSEEKRNIIGQLIEMYDVKTAADIQEALKDLLGGTIQNMLESELETQKQEREEADPEYSDSRNGYKPRMLKSSMGEIPIQVPQDRNSDFEPQVVPKYKRDISGIEGKIIAMYARGIRGLRGRTERRQGSDCRGVSAGGISEMHRTHGSQHIEIRGRQGQKAFANNLKTIYHAPDEQSALTRPDEVRVAWEDKYAGCMKRWSDSWDCVSSMFKSSQTVRKVMYTTNAIENLNSGFRRLNRGRTVFPNDAALFKALYLANWELTKKWIMPVRNWGAVYAELNIMYPGRLTQH